MPEGDKVKRGVTKEEMTEEQWDALPLKTKAWYFEHPGEAPEFGLDENGKIRKKPPEQPNPEFEIDDLDIELGSQSSRQDTSITIDTDDELELGEESLVSDDLEIDDLEIDVADVAPDIDISLDDSLVVKPNPEPDQTLQQEVKEIAANTDVQEILEPVVDIPNPQSGKSFADIGINTDTEIHQPPPLKIEVTPPHDVPYIAPEVRRPVLPHPTPKIPKCSGFVGELDMNEIVRPEQIRNPEDFVKALENTLRHAVVPEKARKLPGEALCITIRQPAMTAGDAVQKSIISSAVKGVDFSKLSNENKIELVGQVQEAIVGKFLRRFPEGTRSEGVHVTTTADVLSAVESTKVKDAVRHAIHEPAKMSGSRGLSAQSAAAQALLGGMPHAETPSLLQSITSPRTPGERMARQFPGMDRSSSELEKLTADTVREEVGEVAKTQPLRSALKRPEPVRGV